MGKKSRDAEIASSKMFGRAVKGETMEQIVEVLINTISQTLLRTTGEDGAYIYWYGGKDDPDPNAYDGALAYWSPPSLYL